MRFAALGRVAVILGLAVTAHGCGKDVPTNQQSSGTTLCISYYAQCVDPIFHQQLAPSNQSCSGQGLGCHSRQDAPDGSTLSEGIGGRFKVNPAPLANVEMTKNFISAKNMATAGSSSLLLTKPLADGVTHTGGDLFPNTSDANYQRILFWLQSPVNNQGDLNPVNDSAQCAALLAANPC